MFLYFQLAMICIHKNMLILRFENAIKIAKIFSDKDFDYSCA